MATDDDDNNRLSFINPRYSLGIITKENGKALVVVIKDMLVASAAMDAYQLGRAIYTDYRTTRNRRPGRRTNRASASVVGGWTGSTLGSAIGTGFGPLFGGFGAVPGGIIGGMGVLQLRNLWTIMSPLTLRVRVRMRMPRNTLFALFSSNCMTINNFKFPGLVF